jgi:antitoxin FitA
MEEEAREILRSALTAPAQGKRNLAEKIRRRFARWGGLELSASPPGGPLRNVPDFEE